ncbi:hypothetical protein [Gordonia sp. OPL2]|uniref:TY-Chap domain-containing protein n=1 Tax=Gordonia sp. OPL2 TaxID=2486274 RepID=UPI001654E7EC|nr:hypothetical protein [Gordonia sp. OPL2]ROZ85491.1 hypothetical protein EEB19_24795 [Gordonia sp. OPL2]
MSDNGFDSHSEGGSDGGSDHGADLDVDAMIDDAWLAFTADLGRRLAAMDIGDEVEVAQSREFPEGPHGVIRFVVTPSGRVRAMIDSSDLHTTPEYHREQAGDLLHGGWRQSGGTAFVHEVGRTGIPLLATVAVRALRDIWEVIHPAFLEIATDAMPAEPVIEVDTTPVEAPTDADEHVCESDSLPAGMQYIIDLDKENCLMPTTIARLCRYDVGVLTGYLEVCERELREWRVNARTVRAQGAEREDIELCDGEAAFWRRFATLLRVAVRIAEQTGSADQGSPVLK